MEQWGVGTVEELEAIYSLYGIYLWGGLFLLVCLLSLWIGTIHLRLSRTLQYFEQLVEGVDGENLVAALERQTEVLHQVMDRQAELHRAQEELERALRRAVQRVGIVRYNPFGDTGGDQSFSVALLDGHNDGVVVTSLFSRSDTRVFAKPILRGQSPYALTHEEREAIALANEVPTVTRAR